MRLIMIRHAEPDYSIDSLTGKGWREAELLAQRISQWQITKIYCSPLGRARDTASFTLDRLQRDAVICTWLREFTVLVKDPVTGKVRIPWDFMPSYWTEYPEMYHKDQWFKTPVMTTGDVEKAYGEVCAGIDGLLAEYGYKRDQNLYRVSKDSDRNACVVLFCHLGVTMTILSHLLGIAFPALTHGFFLAPTSVTVLHTEEREEGLAYFRVQVMGDTRHLAEGNEPVSRAGSYADPFAG